MLKLEDLEAWIKANASFPLGTPAFALNRRKESPDRLIQLVEMQGVPVTDTEMAFDTAVVQVIFRGERNNPPQARDDAHALDKLVVNQTRSFYLGSSLVISTGRVGGGPGYLEIDDDERPLYYCAYWFTIQR